MRLDSVQYLKTAIADMQEQINHLAADLAKYATGENPSQKFIAYKEVQIKVFKKAIQQFVEFKAAFEGYELQVQAQKAQLREKIFKLEAVCLMHGLSFEMQFYHRFSCQRLGEIVRDLYADQTAPKPIRTAEKPLVGEATLRLVASKNPGILTQAKTILKTNTNSQSGQV